MNNPNLYARSNPFQVRDASHVLQMYRKAMTSSSDDIILDVGCGTGDVTTRILAPSCGRYELLVGVDLSEDMVDYARQHSEKDNIHYEVLDIAGDVSDFREDWLGFSKVYSFYCLHWVKDQRKALRNIFSLMLNGAECLLVFVAQCPVFEMYEVVAKEPRWAPYMEDVNEFVPNTQHMTQPAFCFTQMMEETGLENVNCTTLNRSFAFSSTTMLRDCVSAVSPFLKRLPVHEKEDFLNNCVRVLASIKEKEGKVNANESCCFSYKLLVAHGTKK